MAVQTFDIYEGLIYTTPAIPKIKNIRGSHLKKTDQIWYRHEEYLSWDWNDDPKQGKVWYVDPIPEQWDWYEAEIDRIMNGEWILINGVPTFFNAFCYFFHQWAITKEGVYPTYKDTSLLFFRFMEIVFSDPRCRGGNVMKGRRIGVSTMSISIMLQFALIKANIEQGIVSKTGGDAEKIFKLMLVNAFASLPPFLKPRISGNDTPAKVLHITKPPERASKDRATSSTRDGLNNKIEWRATSGNVFDGDGLWMLLVDECFDPETKIMVEGYTFKAIKDIKIGDKVVVEGGKLIEVQNTVSGIDDMYRIKQPYSKDYIVSSKHKLYLEQRCNVKSIFDDGIKTMTPEEFINLGKYRKRTTFGLRSSGIDFPEIDNLIDPYVFGAWIGDGIGSNIGFVVNEPEDRELIDYLKEYATKLGYDTSIYQPLNSKKAKCIYFVRHVRTSKSNPLLNELKRLGVYKNKFIPDEYLFNSRENRLQLLAGIIDTDGHCDQRKYSIHICMSREDLIGQICFLARSLGFSTSTPRFKNTNYNTDSYVVSISGDLSIIPTKLNRKQFPAYKQTAKYRRNRIEVIPEGVGKYVGIQLKTENLDDKRLILEDFTLSMNCGKWEEVDINAYLPIALKSIVAGKNVGRLLLITTVNSADKGGSNYKAVWDGSSQLKRDAMGQTEKKLYRLFIPGFMGYEWFVDKFGNSVVETPTPEQTEWLKKDPRCLNAFIGSKEYCDLQRKNKENDPEDYMEEVRMVPYNPEEVFKSANNLCHFNTIDLNNQIERVEEIIKSKGKTPWNDATHKGDENGRRGLFKKPDGGKVEFVDNSEGMWHILELLPFEEANKFAFKGSIKCPDNTSYGAAGLDTFANAKQTVDKGSDACCVIFKRRNALNPHNSGMPVAMFIGRPKTKQEFHNQIFWGLEYYGIRMLAERSPTDWEDYATDEARRLASPIDQKKKFGYLVTTKRADDSEVYGIAPQDTQSREEHLTEMVEYALNNMEKIYFIRILRDMLKFNIKERTDYDAGMAFGYSLMALKEKTKPIQSKQSGIRYIKTYRLGGA
jgi:hypothetical protein